MYQISRMALDRILKDQHFDRTANLVQMVCDEKKPVKVYCFWNRTRWAWHVVFYTVGHPMLCAYWRNHTLEISSETLFHDLEREIAEEEKSPKQRYQVHCYSAEWGSTIQDVDTIDQAREMIEKDAKEEDPDEDLVYEVLGRVNDDIKVVARYSSGKWE